MYVYIYIFVYIYMYIYIYFAHKSVYVSSHTQSRSRLAKETYTRRCNYFHRPLYTAATAKTLEQHCNKCNTHQQMVLRILSHSLQCNKCNNNTATTLQHDPAKHVRRWSYAFHRPLYTATTATTLQQHCNNAATTHYTLGDGARHSIALYTQQQLQ